MATYYVWSGAGGTADGSSWANAYLTLAAAFAARAAGSVFLIASDHAEDTAGAVTLNAPTGSLVDPVSVISTNRADDTYLAGARISVNNATNNSVNFATSGDQGAVYRGVTFSCESGANSTNNDILIATGAGSIDCILEFLTCTFTIKATSTTANLFLGAFQGTSTNGARCIKQTDCTWNMTNAAVAGWCIVGSGQIDIVNLTPAFSGATKPTRLFQFVSSVSCDLTVRDTDLSAFNPTAGFLFDVGGFTNGKALIRNCKLPTSPDAALKTGTFPGYSSSLTVINCDDADTLSAYEYYTKAGALTQTASVYAGSGAAFAGSAVGWQIVTTAECGEGTPFCPPPLQIWNDGTAAITVTVEFVHDSATALHDRNIWSTLSYTSSATFPRGTAHSNRNADPFVDATPANHGAGAATWTGTGGFANENKQKLSHGVTPAEKCMLQARLAIGVASKTLYVDPVLRVA